MGEGRLRNRWEDTESKTKTFPSKVSGKTKFLNVKKFNAKKENHRNQQSTQKSISDAICLVQPTKDFKVSILRMFRSRNKGKRSSTRTRD